GVALGHLVLVHGLALGHFPLGRGSGHRPSSGSPLLSLLLGGVAGLAFGRGLLDGWHVARGTGCRLVSTGPPECPRPGSGLPECGRPGAGLSECGRPGTGLPEPCLVAAGLAGWHLAGAGRLERRLAGSGLDERDRLGPRVGCWLVTGRSFGGRLGWLVGVVSLWLRRSHAVGGELPERGPVGGRALRCRPVGVGIVVGRAIGGC